MSIIKIILVGLGLLFSTVASAPLTTTSVSKPLPKRGIGYNEDIDISGFGGGPIFFQYNWDSDTSRAQSYTEFIPMLWSDQAWHTDTWNGNVKKWLGVGDWATTHLMGFNEPEDPQQSNMTAPEAVSAYLKWITPYADKATLVGPAITQGGLGWMAEFWPACKAAGCQIDIAAVHWYNHYTLFADFQNFVNEASALVAPAKIWVTEFQGTAPAIGNDNLAQQSQFMAQALPWLDDNPCVDRYVWFGSADPDKDLLVGKGPQLSTLGSQYVNTAF